VLVALYLFAFLAVPDSLECEVLPVAVTQGHVIDRDVRGRLFIIDARGLLIADSSHSVFYWDDPIVPVGALTDVKVEGGLRIWLAAPEEQLLLMLSPDLRILHVLSSSQETVYGYAVTHTEQDIRPRFVLPWLAGSILFYDELTTYLWVWNYNSRELSLFMVPDEPLEKVVSLAPDKIGGLARDGRTWYVWSASGDQEKTVLPVSLQGIRFTGERLIGFTENRVWLLDSNVWLLPSIAEPIRDVLLIDDSSLLVLTRNHLNRCNLKQIAAFE